MFRCLTRADGHSRRILGWEQDSRGGGRESTSVPDDAALIAGYERQVAELLAGVEEAGVVLLMVVLIPLWLLLGTAAARDADAGGRHRQGRWVGVAWVLCWPVGVVLWMNSRRCERAAEREA